MLIDSDDRLHKLTIIMLLNLLSGVAADAQY
jgi:hypothetical protein